MLLTFLVMYFLLALVTYGVAIPSGLFVPGLEHCSCVLWCCACCGAVRVCALVLCVVVSVLWGCACWLVCCGAVYVCALVLCVVVSVLWCYQAY